jgi:multidrug efflux pump subunit AcrB
MWIVRLALHRPYTFVVAALVLLLLTPFVLLRTPTDIFPAIDIPVVSAVWVYSGLSAQEVEQRISITMSALSAHWSTISSISNPPPTTAPA